MNKIYLISGVLYLTSLSIQATPNCTVTDYASPAACTTAMNNCEQQATLNRANLNYYSYFSTFASFDQAAATCPNTASGTCEEIISAGCALTIASDYPGNPVWQAAKLQLATVANGLNSSPQNYPLSVTQPTIYCSYYCSNINNGTCQVLVPSNDWDCSATPH